MIDLIFPFSLFIIKGLVLPPALSTPKKVSFFSKVNNVQQTSINVIISTTMSNPIANMFGSLQETEASRIGRLGERLAEGSINAQKQSDEYSRPNLFMHMYYLQDEPRQKAYNVYSTMNSYFKGRDGGSASSFGSVRYYNEKAKNKRDDLIAEAAVIGHKA